MKPDDIISYAQLVQAERSNLQRGMNFGCGKKHSVFLMSLRKGAPYADAIDPKTGWLIYEGHDQPRSQGGPDPKTVDQPMLTPKGAWTENGKFFRAAVDYQSGLRKQPELIKVYEKLADGIWCYKGFFELTSAAIVADSPPSSVQVLSEAGAEANTRHSRRPASYSPHSHFGKVGGLEKRPWQMCRVRRPLKPTLRSRYPLFERRQQSHRRQCPVALRQAQSAEIRSHHLRRADLFHRVRNHRGHCITAQPAVSPSED
jgi:hypothetical protein